MRIRKYLRNIGEMRTAKYAKYAKKIRDAENADGFDLGVNMGRVAGARIKEHLNWHNVPHWSGDTNSLVVFADLKVIPDRLEKVYDRLKAEIFGTNVNYVIL